MGLNLEVRFFYFKFFLSMDFHMKFSVVKAEADLVWLIPTV